MTATLIRGADILAMGGAHGAEPFRGDILVEAGRIAAIGGRLEAPPGAEIVDGRDRLAMPGLVNGHLHSSEQFFKGRYQNLPLELWLLYAYPLLMGDKIGERLLHLRTLLVAMESLKGGATTICDLFFDPPGLSLHRLGIAFSAYEASGVRAAVANSVIDIPVLDTLPYARQIVPEALQRQLDYAPMSAADFVAHAEESFAAFHGRAGRLSVVVSPSAPQRCTPALQEACADLARRHRVPFHTHVLETKTQAVTGPEHYGRSLIRYMRDLGLLFRNTTIAHSVWVSEEDMAMMGEAGVSVVHNAVSNQKLGAGIAPLRRLLDAGVAVALGTDGACSNDTLRMFDITRVAGLIHSASGPDHERWLTAEDILEAATMGGARSLMMEDEIGSLEVGKRADLILIRTDGIGYTPRNDLRKHVVFGENGSNVALVMVGGEVVCRDGRLTTVDEEAVLAEVRELVPPYLAEHARTEERNRALHPYFAEIHRRATIQDIGLDRYAGDMPAWPGANRA